MSPVLCDGLEAGADLVPSLSAQLVVLSCAAAQTSSVCAINCAPKQWLSGAFGGRDATSALGVGAGHECVLKCSCGRWSRDPQQTAVPVNHVAGVEGLSLR